MKFHRSMMLVAVAVAALATTVSAMPTGQGPGNAPGAYPMDCVKAKDKARCESLNKDIAACKDKTDAEWRQCMRLPPSTAKFIAPKPRDCAKARDKVICETHTKALEACRDRTTRNEHRKCMTGQLRPRAN